MRISEEHRYGHHSLLSAHTDGLGSVLTRLILLLLIRRFFINAASPLPLVIHDGDDGDDAMDASESNEWPLYSLA